MGDAPPAGRARDAERSREAILDAAELLFAEAGYEATSLQAIGARAGVSRGTPGYFFGSKEALYRAVLERLFAAELAFVTDALAGGAEGGRDDGPERALATAVGGYLDFLAARPSFVRLMEREALAGGATLRATAAHATSMREGLAIATAMLDGLDAPAIDPAAFLLSVLALCWFPFAHADTFGRDLGFDPWLPADRERWRQAVVDLVLHGIRAG